jgi:hypothetical protein
VDNLSSDLNFVLEHSIKDHKGDDRGLKLNDTSVREYGDTNLE